MTMATHPALPSLAAASRLRRSTRASSLIQKAARAKSPSRSRRPQACSSGRWADLAGQSVALSGDIPVLFDAPLAPHHRLLGRWALTREASAKAYTRAQARRHIERVFNAAVLEILKAINLVELRITVLHAEEGGPPAVVMICESVGQLDLGWIETSDVPIPWRAAAYKSLEECLGLALPVFGYRDLFDEIALYYWDGETDDDAARQCLIELHGADPDDFDEETLPSSMNARRPEWMVTTNAAPLTELPPNLRQKLSDIRETHAALRRLWPERNAWHLDTEILYDYLPGTEECSSLPPLTLVPLEQFARELDDVAHHGMEMGFMDVVGICPLPTVKRIDDWFASLQLGAEFLLAAQSLIQLDPAKL